MTVHKNVEASDTLKEEDIGATALAGIYGFHYLGVIIMMFFAYWFGPDGALGIVFGCGIGSIVTMLIGLAIYQSVMYKRMSLRDGRIKV